MAFNAAGSSATLQFKLMRKGQPFDCTKDTSSASDFTIGSYWAEYDPATRTYPSDQSLVGDKAYDAATNTCTFTKTGLSAAVVAKMAGGPGIVTLYGVDGILRREGHLSSGKYPFAGILKVNGTNFASYANVSGCESCHTQPFLKHTYIYGKVTDNSGNPTEFYTCKGCHYDQRDGHDQYWQILKDNPARAAEIDAGSAITADEATKYAYKAKLMNDVHMSHNMEFAYPQNGLFNCGSCHAGQLDNILADSQFKPETCISCHSVDGILAKMSAASFNHSTIVADTTGATLRATNCQGCHSTAAGIAPTFKTVHGNGYDPKIYALDGTRYSDTFLTTVDSATYDAATHMLDIHFSATGDLGSMHASDIMPTITIGLYGYNTKDFIVAAHGRDDGVNRNLEHVIGTTDNARYTDVDATGPAWEVMVNLSTWADKLDVNADGIRAIRRAEIAVMPELRDANNTVVGLNAPSRTFDLTQNAFDDTFYPDIVNVLRTTGADGKVTGCNTCHDQLATTFHSGTRGGNIRVCRICHEVQNGGSHLELQSRSIDSYVHAIHSFQAFDIGDIDFTDAEEGAEYEHHIESHFPRFGIENCESCHVSGLIDGRHAYDVPDQSKSMPGVLSGTDPLTDRSVSDIGPAVTGPAVRACGACHRAQALNADDQGLLQAQIQHWKTFGYYIETDTDTDQALWAKVVEKIQPLFDF
jgi:Outer membrane cytochrome MtrC/MtrF-like, domains II/IV